MAWVKFSLAYDFHHYRGPVCPIAVALGLSLILSTLAHALAEVTSDLCAAVGGLGKVIAAHVIARPHGEVLALLGR
jgi:hypothetical protein